MNKTKTIQKKTKTKKPNQPKKAIISLRNVSKIYELDGISINALDDVNFDIFEGEYVSIMGPSGSGKTTLLDVVTTMMKPTKGSVLIEGVNTTKMSNKELASFRGKKIGFIFQTFNLLPKLTALENVITPLWINAVPRNKRETLAKQLLTEVGLDDRMGNRPNQLSGGQKQRVAIARALAMNPRIIVADEPTGNLDSKSSKMIMDIINDLHKTHKVTVVVVTHDESVGRMAQRRILIRDGKISSEREGKAIKKIQQF